jgi:hypothetical protein
MTIGVDKDLWEGPYWAKENSIAVHNGCCSVDRGAAIWPRRMAWAHEAG